MRGGREDARLDSPPSPPPRHGPRRELKFRLDPEEAAAIAARAAGVLAPDPHVRDASRGYRVESLYFDTPEFDCLRRRGPDGLPRYRLRRYEDRDDPRFLEEKLRRGDLVWKRRLAVSPTEIAALDGPGPLERPPLEWFRRRFEGLALRPVLLVTYRRLAFVGAEGERLTIDLDLRTRPPEGAAEARLGTEEAPEDAAILEMKFMDETSRDARAMRDLHGGESIRFSKYARSVAALGLRP
ncbi:MAG: polyphosphate polymerase domain-containing protein [Planctomycetota bacterium]